MNQEDASLTAAEFLAQERKQWSGGESLGLAISGGGIRSATFSLGVLQCLAAAGLLEKLGYLATVSGGGYIGTWLSTWASRRAGIRSINDALKPRPDYASGEAAEITWLRKYGNYLAPKVGLLSADTWAMATIWASNTMLTMLTLAALLLACLLVPWMTLVFFHWPQTLVQRIAIWSVAMILLVLAPLFYLRGKDGQLRGWVPAILVCLSSVLTVAAYWTNDYQGHSLSVLWPWSIGVGALCAGICSWGMLKSGWHDRPSWPRAAFRGLLGVLVGAGGFWVLHQLAEASLAGGELIHAAVWPALLALGDCAILSLTIGAIGWRMPDYDREGWRRVAAYICILLIAGVGLELIAYFGPVLVGMLWKLTAIGATAGSIWAIISALGTWLGRSNSTSGDPNARNPILDLLPALGGVVFTLGLLVILSVGAFDLLHLFTGAPNSFLAWAARPADASLGAATDWAGVWEDLRLAYHFDLNTVLRSERAWMISFTPIALFGLFLLFSRLFSINEFSLHAFYRNRLVRAYCGASSEERENKPSYSRFTNLGREDDIDMRDLTPRRVGFLHLICCAANVNLEETGFAERKAAPFVFTPFGCGYVLPDCSGSGHGGGYQLYPLADKQKKVTAGTAMSISGAAASPNMGYHTSAIAAFLLSVFNVRLGYWIWNTGRHRSLTRAIDPSGRLAVRNKQNIVWEQPWEPRGPQNGAFYYLAELFGMASQNSKYIYLSDGGHFENLAVYELLRRRVKYIICIDAEADPDFVFDGLGGLVRKARSDMGIEIDLDTSDIDPVKEGPQESWWSRTHTTVGKITYPPADGKGENMEGWILYLKLSVTGDEPQDVLSYRKQSPDFPHQSTADQFFAESQFESYRRLGLHVARTTLYPNNKRDGDKQGDHTTIQQVEDLKTLFENLRKGWTPTPRAIAQNFTKHSDRLKDVLSELQTRAELRKLGRQLTPALCPDITETIEATGPEHQESFFFCQRLLQLMEDVYVDLQLETTFDHPACSGWMNQFRSWAASEMMDRVYSATRETFGTPFRSFFERRLQKTKK